MKRLALPLSIALLALTACSGGAGGFDAAYYPPGGGGDFGATPGGVKDLSFARELVANGQVPPAEALLVEAMFAEHDLPLTGQPCTRTLCLRSALGVAPNHEGLSRGWLQVGLSSTIDPATYVRPTLTLVFAVDISGSMSWDYGGQTGGAIAEKLLHDLTSQLGASDRVAIVAFDDTDYDILALTPGDQQTTIHGSIESLEGGGGTNIEAGLSRAYEVAVAAESPTEEVRVVLITDAQPNIGATSTTAFEQMAIDGAAQNIGLTVFGTALGLSAELFASMADVRGANAFSLMSVESVATTIEESWPWMFSPIAYDLVLTARPSAGFKVRAAYGFPGEPDPVEAKLAVSTIFLSKKKGALLLEIGPDPEAAFSSANASLRLDYVEIGGEAVHEELSAGYQGEALDEEGRWFPQAGLAKSASLALLVDAMHRAADSYETDHAAAVAILTPARDRFVSDAAAIGDPAISAEIDFTNALLVLMQNDAPQGSLYPY